METYEDLEYSLGSPYWRGRGNRLWTPESEENKAEFIGEVCETPIGEKFCAMFDAESINPAWDKVIATHQSRSNIYGNEITFSSFIRCLTDAIHSGAIQTPPPAQPKPRELSSSQKAWQEYRIFSESHSMTECRNRARIDAGFQSFMHENLEREFAEQPVGDAVVAIGTQAVRQDKTRATNNLREFAEAYRRAAASEVRKLSSPALNPNGYKEYQENLNAAINAGLI